MPKVECYECDGYGFVECDACDGIGEQEYLVRVKSVEAAGRTREGPCSECEGTGEIMCSVCGGEREVEQTICDSCGEERGPLDKYGDCPECQDAKVEDAWEARREFDRECPMPGDE